MPVRNDGKPIGALHLRHRGANGLSQIQALIELIEDQVRKDFGIRFRRKDMPTRAQFLLQSEVVLDDAVVNDSHSPIGMGMGVLVRGSAVRGPAGMPDSGGALRRLGGDAVFQVLELAVGADDRQPFAVDDRDAGGVIAAVFELFQTGNKYRCRFLATNVPNNPAHH